MAPRALLPVVLLAPLGCTLPQRPAELPPRSEGDVAVHGVVRYEPAKLDAVTRCLEVEELKYHREYPQYFPIPGPNSNTIVDVMLRRCGIHVELPATAIGRDYRGPIGVSVTSLGTGLQLETWIVGLKLGLEEGVELHVADLALGVHFWPPGITVPVNPGRIGFDATMHRKPSETGSGRFGEREDDPDRKYGVSSIWMWSRATRVAHPEEASGLAETAMVGLGARAGVAWFPANADRRGGSMLSPVADELTLSTFARFGRSPRCRCSVRDGRGYFFALERHEILHTYWLGLTFGVEVDFGG